MELVQQVGVPPRSLGILGQFFRVGEITRAQQAADRLRARLGGNAIWNVNSTARGGGVAEMLHSLVAYTRGAGIDCSWLVIEGNAGFFQLTKRLHNALHGAPGDDCVFTEAAGRTIYEDVCRANAAEMFAVLRPGDVVILHDPQTLGLAPALESRGMRVIWRCHIGTDKQNEHSRASFAFLAPYFEHVHRAVFSRAAYMPAGLTAKGRVIAPSIDPISAKNQPLEPSTVRSILVQAGLFEGPQPDAAPEFTREDGSLAHVTRGADIVRLGRACREGIPWVVQISRWDRLKDHLGVLQGFARYVEDGGIAHLTLAGPSVNAVADDPEGAQIFEEILCAYRALPHAVRACMELVNLPMADSEENGAIVNALQRKASVVVQKSLHEGFGLTVSEAMWKGKPVIATRVGGIQDQIEHDISGVLLDDPHDQQAFCSALAGVLKDPGYAERLGVNARERVREHFLSLRSLYSFADLIEDVLSD